MEIYFKNPVSTNNFIKSTAIDLRNTDRSPYEINWKDVLYVWKNYFHFLSLETLIIWNIDIGEDVGKLLLHSAKNLCPRLKDLQLVNVNIGKQICNKLRDMLADSKCAFRVLDLSDNNLDDVAL